MKHFILILLALILLASSSNAVITFERWYGGIYPDCGLSVVQNPEGGYFIAGGKNYDLWIIKTDSIGDTVWTKTYDGTCYCIAATEDGGYILTGSKSGDAYIVKIDYNGDTLWTKTYGDAFPYECGYSVSQTSDNGYIIAGKVGILGSYWYDVYILRTDSIGDTLWTKTYGGVSDMDVGNSVAEITDGEYLVVGGSIPFGPGFWDVYLLKLDSLGDTIWTKTYGLNGADIGHSLILTSDGGCVIAGQTVRFNNGYNSDIYLLKTDSLGDTIWTKAYGDTFDECGYSLARTLNGGFVIAGCGNYDDFDDDVILLKTDSLGDSLWLRTFGGSFFDFGFSVDATSDGGCIITGGTWSFAVDSGDVYLIKTDSLGNVAEIKETENPQLKNRNLKLTIYPNPFTTEVSIKCSGISEKQKVTLEIYDVSGRLVKSVPLTTNHLSLGTDLIPGIYFLKLNGKPVGKVVKVR